MKTIFTLFERRDEAEAAVAELIGRHFDEAEMNVIVRECVTGTSPDATVAAMNETGFTELMGCRSVIISRVGALPVVDKIAALTCGAAIPGKPPQDLTDIIAGLGVPEDLATFYCNGVLEGGLFFWVRTEEGRVAEVTSILSSTRPEKLAHYG
jgi:hypothetical protein